MIILSLTQASIERSGKKIITDFSLNLSKGSVITITGDNGVGKSTLLLALSGELPLTRGQLLIDSREVKTFSLKELAQIRSFSGENIKPTQSYSTDSYIKFAWASQSNRSVPLFLNLVEKLELSEMLAIPVTNLSEGQFQRVNLAKTLLQDTQITLLDEPTSSLDENFKKIFKELVFENVSKGKAFIIATHDLTLSKQFNSINFQL